MSKRNKKIKKVYDTSLTSLKYTGPVVDAFSNTNNSLCETVLKYVGTLSSSGGIIVNVFGSSPSSATGWSDFSTVYKEYRTLAYEVEFSPNDRYNKGIAIFTTPIVAVVDKLNSTALSSYAQAMGYDGSSVFTLDDPWKKSCNMVGQDQSVWILSSSPVSKSWIKLYSDNLSTPVDYGVYTITYRVQFKSRG